MVRLHKVVQSLPDTLEPDSIYYVKRGAGVDVYVTNRAGNIVAYPQNQRLSVYTSSGMTSDIKIFIGEAISDKDGLFYVDWSRAGFTIPPLHVSVTSYKTVSNANERVFCSMSEDITAEGGYGYTQLYDRRAFGFSRNRANFNNGNFSPEKKVSVTKVTVMAYGI